MPETGVAMRTLPLCVTAAVSIVCVLSAAAAAQRTRAVPQRTAAVSSQQNTPSPPASTTETLPPGHIEHGRYLAEHVANCIECHSTRDANGEIIKGEEYLGGSIPFAPPWPNDWAMRAPRNRGLVGYDDKAALRLLTQGAIGRDGKPLRRPMPRFFMTPQDAADVIAYLRSLN
jgi:mono/diheme cytochrome c family protein